MRQVIRKLLLLWITSISALVPLYINLYVLHYQTDPFISTTINMGKLISSFGDLNNARHFVLDNWVPFGWQGHTRDFIQYEPLSGVLVHEIGSITNLSIRSASYLPVPYFVYLILLYLIMKWAYSLVSIEKQKMTKLNVLVLFILFASGYAYICLFVIGTFYVFEYHGIYYVYALTMYYLLLNLIFNRQGVRLAKRIIVLITLVFLANLFTHYEIPLTVTGGLLLYLFAVYWLSKITDTKESAFLKDLKVLIAVFMVLIFSQGFYYSALSSSAGIIQMIPVFFTSILDRVISGSAGQIVGNIYPYGNYLVFTKKLWHLGFAAMLLLQLSLAVYLVKKHSFILPVIFSYLFILGRDISWMISYFAMYLGSFSFELKTAWLLNLLVPVPILGFSHLTKAKRKRASLIILAIIISIALIGWSTLYAHMFIEGYSAYPGQVKEQAWTVAPFIKHNLHQDNISIVITGSLQATSGIYENMPLYVLDEVYLVPAIFYIKEKLDTKQHIPVQEIPNSLRQSDVDFLVVTEYENKKGFYGGLAIAPLNKDEVKLLTHLITVQDTVIYSSDIVKIYMIREG
ncbi:hypothetical protein [Thermococcus sp. ES12]|uniref:hypothetical protein n=1 Tax=Thermococcus sp. ES12 TaxID=1638246 RepID=UPI00142FC408|nr:hypothetical protein [Thermococcus sp. ES12]NJE77284.1 hypothetical protein [Thermococcus sp. ES12]